MQFFYVIVLSCLLLCNYGQSRPQPENSSLIVGGRPVNIENYPFTVRLRIYIIGDTVTCTGTALSFIIILTAAHCLLGHPYNIKIQIGISTLYQRFPHGVKNEYETDVFKVHEEFNRHTFENDVALIGVNINATGLGRKFRKVELPLRHSRSPPAALEVHVLGWGTVTGNPEDTSDSLKAVTLTILDRIICESIGTEEYHVVITRDMFCAVDYDREGRNTCYGDSGGPLVNGFGMLVGIVSRSPVHCDKIGGASIHVDIPRMREWIWLEGRI